MKTFIICFVLAVSTSLVSAEVQLQFKDGRTLTWSEYTEENDSYCTSKAGGIFCVPKSDVVSVKEVKEEFPEATIITPQPRSAEEKERDRNNFVKERLIRERAEAESAACHQMAEEIQSLAGSGNIIKSMYAIAQAKLYQCRCIDKLKNCHLVSPSTVAAPAGNDIYRSSLSDRQSKNCSADVDCGIGYACVKQPYNLSGICMRTVNEFGNPTYSLPSLDRGHIKSEGDCQWDTDCPIGFRCDLKYKTCVK